MLRKLLTLLLLAGFCLAIHGRAFAAKDPSNAKRLPQSNPDAPKASAELNSALPAMPPMFTKTVDPSQHAEVNGELRKFPTSCDVYSYWDGTPYWFWTIPDVYGDDFFNMQFSSPEWTDVTLTYVYLAFYDAASSVISQDGIDVIIWEDDGFSFPGAELARVNVPAAQMAWFPNALAVDFTSFNIEFHGSQFHIGFTTVNQDDDTYALLSDEGTTGSGRSSESFTGMWGTILNDWGLDVNFAIEAELCDDSEDPCTWLRYGTFAGYYYWTIPDQYGDDFFNERFTNSSYNWVLLDKVCISLYQEGSVDVTGEGIDLMIWEDDDYYPGELILTVNVPTADIVWYPGETEVDLTPYNIEIAPNHSIHIGYTTVNQEAGNVMAIMSDNGSGDAVYRSSEFWSGVWGLMIDDWGIDVDFLIEAHVCVQEPPPECLRILKYNEDAYYYWELPDEYGDALYNMRFTMPSRCCWIFDLSMSFYRDGSVGNPGAEYILLNSDGTYPTDTIAVYTTAEVTHWYPDYETIDIEADHIAIENEFHLALNPILNEPGDVLALISDDGASATGRGGVWDGNWYTMFIGWGVDVAFFMTVDICQEYPCPDLITCVDETDWPTLNHDYARTANSKVEIGDLCGFQKIWEYWSPYDFCYFANPTIADGLIYASFGVHIECFTVEGDGSGGPVSVWSTTTADPVYATILGGGIRSTSTIDDGVIYFGAGTLEGFVAADAYTGVPIWIRSPLPPYSNPLEGIPGQTRFCPTVIIGDFIYFGGDGGTVYKLNKYTGVTDVWRYTPHGNPTWNSPSSDGVDLYIGCSEGLAGGDAGPGATAGAVYKLRGSDLALHPDWPDSGFSGLLGYNEGTTAGATYSEEKNWLFTNLAMLEHVAFDSYSMIIDAADGSPVVDNYWLSGLGYYAPAAVFDDRQLWYYGAVPNNDARFSGIWCRNYDNMTYWQDFSRGAMTNPAALTCDPYVFWGTRIASTGYGTFNCSNAESGNHLFTYYLTGYGFGSAIAKYDGVPYIAQTQLWSDCGTGGGRLTMYSIGDDRPRLDVSAGVTLDPPLSFADPSGTQRTVEDLFSNLGCAPLEYCLSLEAHPSYPAGADVMTIDPRAKQRADRGAEALIDHTIDDFNAMEGWKEARMLNPSPMKSEYADREMRPKQSDFTLSTPPSWVTLASPATGVLAAYQSYDAVLEFDVPNMLRGSNLFYVFIATDDPDFNECPTTLPLCDGLEVNARITIDAVVGFNFCDFYLDFGYGGSNHEYANNGGWFDNGHIDDAFIVDGMNDPMYIGSYWWGFRRNQLAWLEEGDKGFNHLFPDAVCTSQENIPIDEYCDGTDIYGDYFSAAIVDSIYNYDTEELADSLTIGMRMVYREIGAFAESGTDYFNNFKLIAYDFSNRNPDPLEEDLYWGVYADWDMPGDPAGYEQVEGDIDASSMWQYNEISGEVAGFGVLPMKGSALYPNGLPATGMYNAYGKTNYVWWPEPQYSLPYLFMDLVKGCSEGNICYGVNATPGSPPDDRLSILTAGRHLFEGYETVQGAFVVYAFPNGATVDEITDLMRFANKWAGYGRGDVNNDNYIDLLDLVQLARYVYSPMDNCGAPCPFLYLGDVDCDDDVDVDDAQYMYDFMFAGGPPIMSKLIR